MEEGKLLEQLPYAYLLHRLYGTCRKRLWRLTEHIGMPKEIFDCEAEQLKSVLEETELQKLKDSKKAGTVESEWEKLTKKGIVFLPYFHPDYPEKLKHIPDAPWGLYLLGRLPEEEQASVAVVGARQCSEYGGFMAKKLGKTLGEAGIAAVSGMARGIDGISQMAAVEAGGQSLAVLGCGVDICYPRENRRLYERLREQGGILSEYPPGTQPLASLFPPRNRIISGLCDVLVVVEAKEKSGTLITVDMALEQGKEVLAVPGRMTDALSCGCNRLIKQGAGILTKPEDIFQALEMEGRKTAESDKQFFFGTEKERRLFHILDFSPKSLEEIWQAYGRERISLPELMQGLLELCLKGAAAQSGGSYLKKA